jgi:hypothetical protein
MADRWTQLHSELHDLCAELESLQKRALHRVEELENDFPEELKKDFPGIQGTTQEMFLTMQRLITKV